VTTGAVLEVSIAAFKVRMEMSRQLVSNRRMWLADSAYGTYVDLVLVQAAARRMPSFVNIMRVTAIFVGAKVRIATISSPGSVPNDVLSRWLQMSFKRTPCMSEKFIC